MSGVLWWDVMCGVWCLQTIKSHAQLSRVEEQAEDQEELSSGSEDEGEEAESASDGKW